MFKKSNKKFLYCFYLIQEIKNVTFEFCYDFKSFDRVLIETRIYL